MSYCLEKHAIQEHCHEAGEHTDRKTQNQPHSRRYTDAACRRIVRCGLHSGGLDRFVIVTAEHNALDITDFLPLRYGLATGIEWLARDHSRDADDVSKICDSFDGMVNTDVSTLAGQPGCLRFVMQEADVFTFQFR